MLRSGRGIIVALGLVLAAHHPNVAAQGQQPSPEERSARALENIAARYDEQSERSKSSPETEQCDHGDDKRYSDLCAQWKAADAAADSAWWAAFAGWFGGLSFIGVLAAIGLAFHSNWIARDTARRQLRAYIEVSECTIEVFPDDGEIIMQVSLQNCGQTPAQEASIMAESFVAPYPLDEERPLVKLKEPGWTTSVGPGKTIGCVKRLWADNVELAVEEAKARRQAFYIQGICEYTDAFGKRRDTCFRYAFAGVVSDAGLVMQSAKTGNYST